MRSKRISSRASLALAGLTFGFVFGFAPDAHADVTRLRVAVESLPLQEKPIDIDSKNVVLPNGAKAYGSVPKSWPVEKDGEHIEGGRCTDERRASVSTINSGHTSTLKIWEADGKTWLDNADLDVVGGSIAVEHAGRTQLGRIADGIWGYRRKNSVVIVAALDDAFIDEGAFYDCRISEREIALPSGTARMTSSPKMANEVIEQIAKWESEPGKPVKRRSEWVGVEFSVFATVSKASADPAPVLNLVVKKP